MRYSKGIVTFVMAGSLSISSLLAGPAFAATMETAITSSTSSTTASTSSTTTDQAKLTQDQAVAIVKAAGLPIPNDTPNNASLNNSKGPYGNRSTWDLNWQLGKPGIDKDYGNISVSIDAVTGSVLNFNVWRNADSISTFPPKITEDKAKSIALTLIQKLQPDKSAAVKLVNTPTVAGQGSLRGPFYYTFHFERLVNGIAVPSDGFDINVDGNGNVANYSFNWTNIPDSQFPDAKSVLSVDKVTQSYEQLLHMSLAYQAFYGPYKTNGPETHLIYQANLVASNNNGSPYPNLNFGDPNSLGAWIDATSGALLNSTGQPVDDSNQNATPQVLDPNGQDSPVTLPQPLTVTQALELAKKFVQVDDSYTLNQSTSNYQGRTTYNFNWYKNDPSGKGGPDGWLGVGIDAQSGQLIQLNQGDANSSSTISQDSAQKIAIDFIKQVLPNRTKAVFLQPQSVFIGKTPNIQPQPFNFSFGMLINGVPSHNDTMNVMVSSSGKILSYNAMSPLMNQPTTQYPDPKKAISVDTAKAQYLAVNPLQLQYVRPMKSDMSGPSDSFILVYAPNSTKPGEVFDAISGDWDSPYGQSVDDANKQATDIKGHWAEKNLQVMINKGILKVVDGKVHPDSIITKADLLRMLILAIGAPVQMSSSSSASFKDVASTNEYFPYVETALTYHWIDQTDNFNPNAPVTREELAELLTRALGYQDLAKYPALFNMPFADKKQIDQKYFGDVAIVNGLDIMHGADNTFKPRSNTSIAEAVVAIFKTVDIINNRTSDGRPIYFLKDLQQKAQKLQK